MKEVNNELKRGNGGDYSIKHANIFNPFPTNFSRNYLNLFPLPEKILDDGSFLVSGSHFLEDFLGEGGIYNAGS